jgi:phosphoglycolate phosphatase-like HAD superfamily hydrolase
LSRHTISGIIAQEEKMVYRGKIADSIKLYIFDLDGTLVDSLTDLHDSVNAILGRYGLPEIDRDFVRRAVGTGARNLLARSFAWSAKTAGLGCPARTAQTGVASDSDPVSASSRISEYPGFGSLLDEALPVYRSVYAEACTRNTSLYPGIREWLEYLARKG